MAASMTVKQGEKREKVSSKKWSWYSSELVDLRSHGGVPVTRKSSEEK